MQAVVLAAGKGRRLWPLTENRPKPMIPVMNRPILDHILDALEQANIEEVILVVGANRTRVQNHITHHDWDFNIEFVVQDPQLGTGHAVLQAEPIINDSFITLNGDRIIDPSLIDAVRTRHHETNDPVIGVTRVNEPSQYGVVTLEDDHVIGITERPIPELTPSNLINAGVYALTPKIFETIQAMDTHGEQALTDALATIIDDQRVHAVHYTGTWLDVSEPWDLLTVNHSLITNADSQLPPEANVATSATITASTVADDGVTIHPQAVVRHGVTLGANVQIGPGAVVENTVMLPDATIDAGAVVRDAVIGANTTLGPNTTIEGGTSTVVLHDTVYDDVRLGALIGDNVAIGGNTTIQRGTIIGNNARLDSGVFATGRIEDDTHVTRG